MFAIWYPYNTKKQISEMRRFLKKKTTETIVKRKTKALFRSYEYVVETELLGNLKSLELNKSQLNNLAIGDRIQIEYEEQTNTILQIKVMED